MVEDASCDSTSIRPSRTDSRNLPAPARAFPRTSGGRLLEKCSSMDPNSRLSNCAELGAETSRRNGMASPTVALFRMYSMLKDTNRMTKRSQRGLAEHEDHPSSRSGASESISTSSGELLEGVVVCVEGRLSKSEGHKSQGELGLTVRIENKSSWNCAGSLCFLAPPVYARSRGDRRGLPRTSLTWAHHL
jgi:hypothetical protein